MKKKIMGVACAFALALSMSSVAFADNETTTHTDMSTVTIDKTYTVTNSGTSYPDETFTFAVGSTYTVTDGGVGSDNQEMPTIGNVSFATEDGTATKSVTVSLPAYTAVGIYSYTITETPGDTAGVEYYDKTIKLVVTVIQDTNDLIRVAAVHTEATGAAKSNDIENVYNAGSLSFGKTVTGLLGDRDKYFAVTVTLTGASGADYSGNVITVSGNDTYADNPESVVVGTPAIFYLKHGETVNLGNIPYGVTYAVTEANLDDYTETITGGDANDGTGTVNSAAETAVVVTNDKGGTVDTAAVLESMPFVVMLVAAGAGLAVFAVRRRQED